MKLETSFTLRISINFNGEVLLWTKGHPDLMTFKGKLYDELPLPHSLGLVALGAITEFCEAQKIKLNKDFGGGSESKLMQKVKKKDEKN